MAGGTPTLWQEKMPSPAPNSYGMFWSVVLPLQGLGEEEATSAEPELYSVTILIRAWQARIKMIRKMLNKGPCREMVVGPNLDHCLLSGEP